MPIDCQIPFGPLSNEEFADIDALVMRCVYKSHNRFGKLCDERVYENDVAAQLRAEGVHEVFTQLPLRLTVGSFTTTLRLDLVVNRMLYEVKAVEQLAPIHAAQVTSYAALLAISRVKLLNFGADSAQGKLIGCPFANIDRSVVTVDRSRWKAVSARCPLIADLAEATMREWGGFLEARLYERPLLWLCGGKERCERKLPVVRDGIQLGQQRAWLYAPECAFVVTTLGGRLQHQEMHLRRLLNALPLRAWQWINVCHQRMRMITIIK
ncbi:MAG: GxxExxY protein [Planctomycetales bacterium]|nr:GxxExxY protein [Planctomycetales bacterium]